MANYTNRNTRARLLSAEEVAECPNISRVPVYLLAPRGDIVALRRQDGRMERDPPSTIVEALKALMPSK